MANYGKFAGDGSGSVVPPCNTCGIFLPLCHICLRYRGQTRCAVHPKRIPKAVLTGAEECSHYVEKSD